MGAVKHHERPLVYIAAPYAHPDPVENTHRAIKAADKLHATGLVTCHVPHLSMLWHLVSPHPVDHWYEYDEAVLKRCDALYRMAGASMGAQAEQALARGWGIPTFVHLPDVVEWAEDGCDVAATA